MHQVHVSLDVTKSIKNNMGIIGYNVRIKKNNGKYFWEVLEQIIGKILSILGSCLWVTHGKLLCYYT